jgi:peptidoglycan/LPS O-acetylase OafA/YrhL
MGVIRVILAISVVIAHVGPIFGFTLLGGPTAVETFYIISGFYMSLILNEKYVGENGSYKLFLSNRLLRLFPIYWVVFVLTIIVSLVFAYHSQGTFWSRLQPYIDFKNQMALPSLILLFFTNVFLIGQDLVMFLGLGKTGHLFFTSNFWNTSPYLYNFLLVPQAWTIGLEITFYLIAPFLVRKKFRVILLFIFISLAIRLFLVSRGLSNDPWNYRFFPNELLFFLLGNIAYKIFKRIEKLNIDRRFLIIILSFILIFILFFSLIDFSGKTYIFFGLFFIALPFIFKLSKYSKLDSYIGDLSYPIYLSHTLVTMTFKGRLQNVFNISGLAIAVILITILFSIFLNIIVTKPVERLRQRRLLRLVSK